MARLRGTEGYSREATALLELYESVPFAKSKERVLPLLPLPPARLLDIGAGTGRDAAGFAALGYDVVAGEPTDELREGARRLHAAARVEWLDDGLPDLAVLRGRGDRFDIVTMTAVWMHLDESERQRGMPHVASLLRPRGVLAMTLRYGPVPPGRRMFEVTTRETTALAAEAGLELLLEQDEPSLIKRAVPVTWKLLVFRK
ncbi:MAG TPA: class I SAM-dependent methyltransferase [Reyranella sp.]|nr:class I SAM-dependent methyltransferase [Reyranella sp.]